MGVALLAHMVTFNEAGRYLVPCLEWLSDIVDFIHVHDDDSTDSTVQIAKKYGAVTQRQFGEPSFRQAEGLFRSSAWAHLSRFAEPGDWVLCLDADEFITSTEDVRQRLDHLVEIDRYDAYMFPVREVFDIHDHVPQVRIDGYWGKITALRFCKFTPNATFDIEGLACGSVPAEITAGACFLDTSVDILHYGYAREEDRRAKYIRYRNRRGHAPKHVESILATPRLVPYDGAHPEVP